MINDIILIAFIFFLIYMTIKMARNTNQHVENQIAIARLQKEVHKHITRSKK